MIQSDLQKAIDKDALMGKSKVYVRTGAPLQDWRRS